jgi:hypothetical protein
MIDNIMMSSGVSRQFDCIARHIRTSRPFGSTETEI